MSDNEDQENQPVVEEPEIEIDEERHTLTPEVVATGLTHIAGTHSKLSLYFLSVKLMIYRWSFICFHKVEFGE